MLPVILMSSCGESDTAVLNLRNNHQVRERGKGVEACGRFGLAGRICRQLTKHLIKAAAYLQGHNSAS